MGGFDHDPFFTPHLCSLGFLAHSGLFLSVIIPLPCLWGRYFVDLSSSFVRRLFYCMILSNTINLDSVLLVPDPGLDSAEILSFFVAEMSASEVHLSLVSP